LKKYNFPLDAIINKVIEIRKSIPSLIIVLACLPLFTKPSINNVILLIALLGWTNFARHARAETLSIKQREYVQAAKIMGASFIHILRHHILPNIGATILTLAISSFTANILLESTLSFLGIGLPPTEVSWGTMIAESRKNFNAWWMFIFPGLTLIILVFSLNYFSSKYLSERD
jgi:peptide/nickel transport system permease protein